MEIDEWELLDIAAQMRGTNGQLGPGGMKLNSELKSYEAEISDN